MSHFLARAGSSLDGLTAQLLRREPDPPPGERDGLEARRVRHYGATGTGSSTGEGADGGWRGGRGGSKRWTWSWGRQRDTEANGTGRGPELEHTITYYESPQLNLPSASAFRESAVRGASVGQRGCQERGYDGSSNKSGVRFTTDQPSFVSPSASALSGGLAGAGAGSGAGTAPPPSKLGTFNGVFMPTCLNILGIILFLRFGFVLGQAGLLGSLFLLSCSYLIDVVTTLSVSAISTNGQVRGGGAYYLISRSLGPEYGGSIGLIFYCGQALNAAMNVLGFVESLTDRFGESRGGSVGVLPEGPWWLFAYGSLVLLLCTIVCLIGASFFIRLTSLLSFPLAFSILSIPVSSFIVSPFSNDSHGVYFTGWSWATLHENLWPQFTAGADGSTFEGRPENWRSTFSVLFPAVTGILAGASMSGDLRKPSKSIPKGTNWALLFTFSIYCVCFIVLAATIDRQSFYSDSGIVADVAISPHIITLGALSSTLFSALMGMVACSKILQAIARDNLLPWLSPFSQGTSKTDEPTYAVLVTYVICQFVLFADNINQIAALVTMSTLLTFAIINLACFTLKAGGSPNFRPSFRFFNIWTAVSGQVLCSSAMYFASPLAATVCLLFAAFLFMLIHYSSPPKSWGDFSQNIIYHQVRKYLLRLDERKAHVKYWRPQILLLANNPRTEWNLIIFCNSLKKGALYVLGHVLKGEFRECLPELRRQQVAWLKLVDLTGIKAFVDVVIADDERQGARNLILSCGLGGMRPNVVVMGFPLQLLHSKEPEQKHSREDGSDITVKGGWSSVEDQHQTLDISSLPTDSGRRETPIKATTYVGIMEDTLALSKALAIGYNFKDMAPKRDGRRPKSSEREKQKYIDLWPIQIMDAEDGPSHAWDTYTLVLQLGTILSMTPSWKGHALRVSVFVENPDDIKEERRRVKALLDNLRIRAELRVLHLWDGQVTSYECIVHGRDIAPADIAHVEEALGGDPWWEGLKRLRRDEWRRTFTETSRPRRAKATTHAATPSKRETQLYGVSLPKDHLEFYRRNVRIGLAHPRARLRLSDSSDSETDWSDSESDELEASLGRLGEDDDEEWLDGGYASGGGGKLKRSATYGTGGLYSKRMRRRTVSFGGSDLPDHTMRTMSMPSRSLEARPTLETVRGSRIEETVREEGCDGPSRPPSRAHSVSSLHSSSDYYLSDQEEDHHPQAAQASTSRMRGKRKQKSGPDASVPSSPRLVPHTPVVSDSERTPSRPKLIRNLSSTASVHRSRPSSRGPSRGPASAAASPSRPSSPVDGAPGGRPSSTIDLDRPRIEFNDLPNRAQYVIINELFRIHSDKDTSVIITSLPAAEQGTADDPVRSRRYLEQLHSLYRDGPPVLGVHAKTLTVTMSL